MKKTIPTQDDLCIAIFSTARAATDKQYLLVEKVHSVAKSWPSKHKLGPLKSSNRFYENSLVFGYCQFADDSLKSFVALKKYSLNN